MARRWISRAWGALTGARARQAELKGLDRTIADQRKQILHLEQLVSGLLGQVQGADLLPPPALRMHVGARDSAANFWRQGRNSSERVIEVFGEQPDGLVLDWGCGSGRTLQWLQARPAWRTAYRGCDVDAEAIAWLQERGVEGVLVCGEAPPLPYSDATFSGLFCFSVLTHIHPGRHGPWLREIRRVLKPGGRAYLTFGGASRLKEAESFDAEARTAFERHGWCFIEHVGHYKSAALVSPAFTRERLEGLFEVEVHRERGYHQMDDLIVRAV